jgi:hypothetical protein
VTSTLRTIRASAGRVGRWLTGLVFDDFAAGEVAQAATTRQITTAAGTTRRRTRNTVRGIYQVNGQTAEQFRLRLQCEASIN